MAIVEKHERIAYFDYMRIFATFLIILLHIASYCWYDTDVHSGQWLSLNTYKSLTDHAVLLFVMISGALFLGRDIPIKKIYLKYVLRMLCAYVFWSFVYSLVLNHTWGIKSVLISTLTSHYHLWFIPMIAGLYICLPIFKLFVRKDILRYFLILSFVFAFLIPQILGIMADFGTETIKQYGVLINDRVDEMGVRLVCGYSFYFMAGYYINKTEIEKKYRIIIYVAGVIGLFITLLLTTMQAYIMSEPLDNYHENFNIAVMLTAIATFTFFKYNIGRKSEIKTFIVLLSESSFAAYLIHALVIEEIEKQFGVNALFINPIVGVLVIGIIVFIISFGIGILLKKIPYVSKYIV